MIDLGTAPRSTVPVSTLWSAVLAAVATLFRRTLVWRTGSRPWEE